MDRIEEREIRESESIEEFDPFDLFLPARRDKSRCDDRGLCTARGALIGTVLGLLVWLALGRLASWVFAAT